MPAHRLLGTLGPPGPSRRGPAQAFSGRSQLCTLCWASAYCAGPFSGALLDLGPNVDGVAGRIQRSELLTHRGDALRGLSNRCTKDTPFVAGGVGLRDGRQRWGGRCIQGRRGDRLVSGRAGLCSHTGAVHGACGSRFSPRVSAGVSMDAK